MTILFSLGYGRERTGFFLGQYEIESMHRCENVRFYLPPSRHHSCHPETPDWRSKEPAMTFFQTDRRLADRFKLKTPLRVRLWKSAVPECRAESVNLSQRGIYFATNSELRKGETVEVFFNMPVEIAGEPTSEWRCTGHVVRVEEINTPNGKQGVGVQFDCYEVSRSTPVSVAIGTGVPARMLSDVAPNGDRIQPWKNERLSWTMNLPYAN
jgi:hypothetical protein